MRKKEAYMTSAIIQTPPKIIHVETLIGSFD
jgi:hypothetical protein